MHDSTTDRCDSELLVQDINITPTASDPTEVQNPQIEETSSMDIDDVTPCESPQSRSGQQSLPSSAPLSPKGPVHVPSDPTLIPTPGGFDTTADTSTSEQIHSSARTNQSEDRRDESVEPESTAPHTPAFASPIFSLPAIEQQLDMNPQIGDFFESGEPADGDELMENQQLPLREVSLASIDDGVVVATALALQQSSQDGSSLSNQLAPCSLLGLDWGFGNQVPAQGHSGPFAEYYAPPPAIDPVQTQAHLRDEDAQFGGDSMLLEVENPQSEHASFQFEYNSWQAGDAFVPFGGGDAQLGIALGAAATHAQLGQDDTQSENSGAASWNQSTTSHPFGQGSLEFDSLRDASTDMSAVAFASAHEPAFNDVYYLPQLRSAPVDLDNMSRTILPPGTLASDSRAAVPEEAFGANVVPMWSSLMDGMAGDSLTRLSIGIGLYNLNIIPDEPPATVAPSELILRHEVTEAERPSPLTDLSSRSPSPTQPSMPLQSLSSAASEERSISRTASPACSSIQDTASASRSSTPLPSATTTPPAPPAPLPTPSSRPTTGPSTIEATDKRAAHSTVGRGSPTTWPYAELCDLHPDWAKFRAVRHMK